MDWPMETELDMLQFQLTAKEHWTVYGPHAVLDACLIVIKEYWLDQAPLYPYQGCVQSVDSYGFK